MWRLKLGEGANDPYLFTTNNFVGRQTWEFENQTDDATLQSRAQVEAARNIFYQNRFNVKPSSDLLWKFQFLEEKNFKQTIPKAKVEEEEGKGIIINAEMATTALRRATAFFAALQSSHGHWPAENSGPLY